MKYNRLYFKKNNKKGFVTMYDLNYNQFFNLLDNSNKLRKEFEKYMKSDFKKSEKITPPKSIIELWKSNKTFKIKKMRICILIYKNNYIGCFRYYKSKFTDINGISLGDKTYIKICIVYIVPKYRRLGLAYSMLYKILNNKNKYLLIVSNNNTSAYNLYKKLGFKKIGSDMESIIMIRN